MAADGRNHVPFVEDDFRASLSEYSEFLGRLDVSPPFRWIAGMENLRGRTLYDTKRRSWVTSPSSHADTVIQEGIHVPGDSPAKSLRPFFVKLFDSCGIDRPEALDST